MQPGIALQPALRRHKQLFACGAEIDASANHMAKTNRIEIIRRNLRGRSIVFIGMMGSGKSAIGRLVASRLGMRFFDSDFEIAAAADMSIPEIFEQFGEAYFRRGEQRVIERLLKEGPAVISLGGGAFLDPKTRALAKQRAVTVWLGADIDLLMHRVMRRPASRPLLQTADPRATLAELLELRRPFYQEADLLVESSRHSKKQTCDNVIRELSEYLSTAKLPMLHPGDG
jgi:shikimate kinase